MEVGSLEQVGYGITQGGIPDFRNAQSGSAMSNKDIDFEAFEDDNDFDDERPTNVRRSPSRTTDYDSDSRDVGDGKSLHIGVHNGVSVHMRVNGSGEAEFNYGGSIWSKSPPPSLSKSKIKNALESLKILGVDTSAYEKSIGSVENYSAPLSMLAEDDIQHSMDVLKSLHEEKASLKKRRARKPEPPGPIFISDPDFESRNKGI